MNSKPILLNFWSSLPHFHLYKYCPSNPQALVIDNLELKPLRERLRIMLRACMIDVKLVLCRFQIILTYTKSLVSQTRGQWWPHILLSKRALFWFTDYLLWWLPSLRSCHVTFLFCQSHSTPAKYSWQLAAISQGPFSENETKSDHPTRAHTCKPSANRCVLLKQHSSHPSPQHLLWTG